MKLDASIAAVVTGGASGLGEAVVRRLAAAGVKVTIFDMNAERGQQVAWDVDGLFCQVDVQSDESVDQGFSAAREAHGQERILVNCAGISKGAKTAGRDRATGVIKAFPSADFDRVIQINLVGSFRCLSRSAAGMLSLEPLAHGERGVIVNTASVAAQDGQVGQSAYSASKAGVVGMTLPIARDLAGEGVRINCILPGLFATPMMAGLPDTVQQSLAASVPFPHRLGLPEEYADLATFLITNSYMNGESVRLDGAIRLAPR
ncbi:SDR family NAD(P)-dependent oxidoreductase [Pseudomonas sp. Bout1]|uniref:SDR family NAD(P)-dependent oxidoreductase n=1 Tax=Pseudomonas sp. Bout1 TaxID=3048600 RepID=UPI002AB5AE6A|nr:SDR family NAD(P)-dependent oxidoreductase [Pseudomonas sp. Bout1]MDY7533060.1 SDR family NAD(P)-dependent oxidoreductase [Pseudomonas sp. Bout1]MEB0184459.1 SDR family NAD(P)-dependent oxidoreductase [Pseudomonas sp. Bout1]